MLFIPANEFNFDQSKILSSGKALIDDTVNYIPAKEIVLRVYWNLLVCPSLCPSVYKILVSVKAQAGVLSHI